MNLMKAVILAGGKGTRLKPYTTFVPKPLMPIGDFPIIEVVLRQLRFYGINQVTVAVGHMAQLIESFIGDGGRFDMKIDYSEESEPLGTAGPLALLRERFGPAEDVLVMNGDLLTTLNFHDAVEYHRSSKAAATICVNRREVPIDFGVLVADEAGNLRDYKEKPVLGYDVSMGINILSRRALDAIPRGRPYTIPELMLALMKAGDKVACFKSSCFWLDIGRVDDYAQACEQFEARRREFLPDEG